jgi:hypothetical protein
VSLSALQSEYPKKKVYHHYYEWQGLSEFFSDGKLMGEESYPIKMLVSINFNMASSLVLYS